MLVFVLNAARCGVFRLPHRAILMPDSGGARLTRSAFWPRGRVQKLARIIQRIRGRRPGQAIGADARGYAETAVNNSSASASRTARNSVSSSRRITNESVAMVAFCSMVHFRDANDRVSLSRFSSSRDIGLPDPITMGTHRMRSQHFAATSIMHIACGQLPQVDLK